LSFPARASLVEALAVQATIVLFAVFAATVANATVFATLGLHGRSVGLSELEVGAVFASSGVLFFLTSSHWGRLSDRVGRGPVMAAGLMATAVSLLLFAGLYTGGGMFLSLLVARSLYGLFAGGIQPAATAWMAGHTPADLRAAGVARIGAAVGVASIAGPVLTASVVGFGLSVPVAVGGVLTTLATGAVLVGLRYAPPALIAAAAGAPSEGLAPYLSIGFAMVLGFGALQATTAFYVQDRFGLATADAIRQGSLASAGFAVGSVIVQAFVVRRLALSARRLLAIGLAVCLVGTGGSLAAPTTALLTVCFGVMGAGYGLAQSGLTAAVSILGGTHRQGQVAGRLQAVMSVAWIVGALGGGALYPFANASPLLVAAAGLALALLATAQIRR
jgi:MFS family permease